MQHQTCQRSGLKNKINPSVCNYSKAVVAISCHPSTILFLSISAHPFHAIELITDAFTLLNASYLAVILQIGWSSSNMNDGCHKKFESRRTEKLDSILVKRKTFPSAFKDFL